MRLKRCHLIKNNCYVTGEKINGKPYGIVVHSTGANNTSLKRYVQPVKGQSGYDDIIADLGVNKNGNHWNRSGLSKCVHAFIGKNAAGDVMTYETLPYNICCWGCGKGKKGSFNYNPTACIQFEICEDNTKNETYFNAVMHEAMEYCAYLCETYNIPVNRIVSHNEAGVMKMGSASADIEHWLKKFSKTMKWFREGVQDIINSKNDGVDYMVYVGTYPTEDEADAMVEKLSKAGFTAKTVEVTSKK